MSQRAARLGHQERRRELGTHVAWTCVSTVTRSVGWLSCGVMVWLQKCPCHLGSCLSWPWDSKGWACRSCGDVETFPETSTAGWGGYRERRKLSQRHRQKPLLGGLSPRIIVVSLLSCLRVFAPTWTAARLSSPSPPALNLSQHQGLKHQICNLTVLIS